MFNISFKHKAPPFTPVVFYSVTVAPNSKSRFQPAAAAGKRHTVNKVSLKSM